MAYEYFVQFSVTRNGRDVIEESVYKSARPIDSGDDIKEIRTVLERAGKLNVVILSFQRLKKEGE